MIYDCFMFFDELMLLEIRLKELYSIVDKFILVEATHTHSGKPKRLYYDEVKNNEVFAPFRDKITHIIYKEQMQPDRFANDRNQRNAIALGLTAAEPDDIIIITDADEIINHETVLSIKRLGVHIQDYSVRNDNFIEGGTVCYKPTRLQTRLFYYYFNCRANQDWIFPVTCRFKDFTTADKLRMGIWTNVKSFCGWHFSYLVPPEQIPKKLEAFAHAEFDTDYFKDTDRLRKCIDANEDIFERGMKFSIEPLDAPRCVMENEDKYRQFIKQEDTSYHFGKSFSG